MVFLTLTRHIRVRHSNLHVAVLFAFVVRSGSSVDAEIKVPDNTYRKNIEPKRHYSGKFNLRIPTDLHEKIAIAAQASGKSMNTLAQEALLQIVQ